MVTTGIDDRDNAALVERRRLKGEAVRTLREALRYLRSDAVGMAAAADQAQLRATREAGSPAVLVLGEPGRGKTSLVQVLAPHDGGGESALDQVYCSVTPPTSGAQGAVRWIGPDGETLAGPAGAVGAVVPWRRCALGSDVTLIDTPCVGGIQGPQATASRALAMSATVAVFVTDAGAPLSQPELDYLEALAAPVHSLVVVVAKTDLYPGSWRDVVQTDRELLATRSTRGAHVAVIGVSSRLAALAERATDERRATELADASGLFELRRELAAVIARAEVAPIAGALQLARHGIRDHRRLLHARLVAMAVPGADLEAVVGEQAALVAALERRQGQWDHYLTRDMARARADTANLAQRRAEEWRTLWRDRLASRRAIKGTSIEALGDQMLWDLAAIRTEVLEQARSRVHETVRDLFSDTEVPAVVSESITTAARHQTDHAIQAPPPLEWDAGLVGQGMLGWNLGKMLAGVVGSAVPGLGTVLQLAGAAGYVFVNRTQRDVKHTLTSLLTEVQRLAAAEQAEILRIYDQVLTEARPEIVIAYREQLTATIKAAREVLAEVRKQQTRSAAEVRSASAALEREAAAADQRLEALDGALLSLLADPDPEPAARPAREQR